MNTQRLENIFGALAFAISDDVASSVEPFLPRDEPPAAIAIIGRSPGWTIRQLSGDLGLSHAATVRLVDRLAADALVVRSKSPTDGRAVCLTLTPAGQAVYDQILVTRQLRLSNLLANLAHAERTALESIAEKLLAVAVCRESDRSRVCRFCDVGLCTSCPIEKAISA